MNKNIINKILKCSDALSKNDNPNKILKDKTLIKIEEEKLKGCTSFLKFKKGKK